MRRRVPRSPVGRCDQRFQSSGSRYGIATVWVIASVPVIATFMVVMMDLANIWLAKSELKNGLDAAALSAAKTWGEGGTTAQARTQANNASMANTVLGSTFTLDTTSGGCTNGNVSSTGEILLGTITDSGTVLTFDCTGTPSCISGTAEVVIAVETDPSGDTFSDPSEADGVARTSFRVERFEETTGIPVGLTLNSVTFDLTTMMTQPAGGGADSPDDGNFDLRGISPSDVAGGIGTPPGPPPAAGLIGVNDQVVGSTFSFTPGSGGSATEPRIVTVNFAGGITSSAAASRFFFGVDTDRVGGDIGMGAGTTVQDFGGEFGTDGGGGSGNDPFTSVGTTVRVNVSGSTFTGTLTRTNADRSEFTFVINIVSGGQSFGVRTRKTIQISSIASTFLGVPLGPYNVTGQSFARFQCTGSEAQLVFVESFLCACP